MCEFGGDETKGDSASIVRSSDDEDGGLVMSSFRQSPNEVESSLRRSSTSSSSSLLNSLTSSAMVAEGSGGHILSALSTPSSMSTVARRRRQHLHDENDVEVRSLSDSSEMAFGQNSSNRAWSAKSDSGRLSRISLEEARNRSYLVGSLSRGSLLGAEQLDSHFPARNLHVFAGTWNMNCTSDAPLNLDEFLLPRECGVDDLPEIYVIGSQENVMTRNEWETVLQETIGLSHVLFRSAVLGTLHLAVFIRRELLWFCSEPEVGNIATRQGSAIKTKGAVALAFRLFGTSFLFINSHLTAHYQNVKERINDYLKIRRGLELPCRTNISNKPPHITVPTKDVTTNFDDVFWLGDLNFRLEIERKQLINSLNGRDIDYDSLLKTDQLLATMSQGDAFEGFSESSIQFPPTFKFDVGSSTYDTSSKCRTPAYTDRILFRARKKESITCLKYNSVPGILTSDHKPLFGVFRVKLRPGRDDIPLAAGHYVRSVYLKALEKRALQMDPLHGEHESRFCSLM